MKEHVIEARSVTKKYKDVTALRDVDITVKRGDIYGLIGDNGAGKTTFLKLLTGQIYTSGGELKLFGAYSEKELEQNRKRTGAIVESPGFYPKLTVEKNLEYYRIQKGIPGKNQTEEALKAVGLWDKRKKKCAALSMGMKQRLGLAIALLGEPELLILDEPINGLDPEGIRELRELMNTLNEEGKTILLSSHILGELSKIASHYGIIREGRMIEQISREKLEEKCRDYFQLEVDNVDRALPVISENLRDAGVEVYDNQTLRIYGFTDSAWLIQLLVTNQVQVYSSGFHHMNLEEYLLDKMEGGARDA